MGCNENRNINRKSSGNPTFKDRKRLKCFPGQVSWKKEETKERIERNKQIRKIKI